MDISVHCTCKRVCVSIKVLLNAVVIMQLKPMGNYQIVLDVPIDFSLLFVGIPRCKMDAIVIKIDVIIS